MLAWFWSIRVNDRGGMGIASGTNNWSVSNLCLKSGYNNITVNAYPCRRKFNTRIYFTVLCAPSAATTNTVFSNGCRNGSVAE